MRHGGDLAAASPHYGIPRADWLDLSTGVSPYAWPVELTGHSQHLWRDLPDSGLEQAAREAACATYGISDLNRVVVASGSQGIIQSLPKILNKKDISILSPTYSEHGKAWARSGCTVRTVTDIDHQDSYNSLLIVNPNNPTGRLFTQDQLLTIADSQTARDQWLIVDEAFGDLTPDCSVVDHTGGRNLIVLRSLGKFYGLAGLRVGFAALDPNLAEELKDIMGPWPVSGLSLTLATDALQDEAWRRNQTQRLINDRKDFTDLIDNHDIKRIGGTDLFQLIEVPDAQGLHDHLATHGIWTRIFDYSDHWLRLGLPDRAMNGYQRLDEALKICARQLLNKDIL